MKLIIHPRKGQGTYEDAQNGKGEFSVWKWLKTRHNLSSAWSVRGLYLCDDYMGLQLRRQQTATCEGFFAQHFCVRVQKLQQQRRYRFTESALDEEVCVWCHLVWHITAGTEPWLCHSRSNSKKRYLERRRQTL